MTLLNTARAFMLSILTVAGLYGAYYVVYSTNMYVFGAYCLTLSLVFTLVLIRNSPAKIICYYLWCFIQTLILLCLIFIDVFWTINPIRTGYHLFTSIAVSATICVFYNSLIIASSVLISAFTTIIKKQSGKP